MQSSLHSFNLLGNVCIILCYLRVQKKSHILKNSYNDIWLQLYSFEIKFWRATSNWAGKAQESRSNSDLLSWALVKLGSFALVSRSFWRQASCVLVQNWDEVSKASETTPQLFCQSQSILGYMVTHVTTICSPSNLNSPGQNTEVGSLSFLQGIFPTQGSNSGLPHCGKILYQLSYQGSPDFGIYLI